MEGSFVGCVFLAGFQEDLGTDFSQRWRKQPEADVMTNYLFFILWLKKKSVLVLQN